MDTSDKRLIINDSEKVKSVLNKVHRKYFLRWRRAFSDGSGLPCPVVSKNNHTPKKRLVAA